MRNNQHNPYRNQTVQLLMVLRTFFANSQSFPNGVSILFSINHYYRRTQLAILEKTCFGKYKSSRLQVFSKIVFLTNFAMFTGKQNPWTLIQVFTCEYCKNFKNSFFYRTPLMAASVNRLF